MYTPLAARTSPAIRRVASVGPFRGENTKQFSGLLDPSMALRLSNYVPDSEGKLKKRKGLKKIYEVAGDNPVTLLEVFTDDIHIFAYATTVAAYTISTDTITTIKNNWTAGGAFCGAKYGDFFFISNGVEKIWRINLALAITEIAASPPSTGLIVLGNRLLAKYDASVQYSEVDTGSDPPFTTWSNSTNATDGGIVTFRNAGDVNKIVTLGNIVIAFADFGKWAFTIDQMDSAGTIKKIDNTVIDRRDLGGETALVCDKGIYYVNESGLWNLQSLGQSNVPFSDQEFSASQMLDESYFADVDFEGATMVYDDVAEVLYVACRKNSDVNNYVIVLNTISGALARFSNWNISAFMKDKTGQIWGGSSISTKIYKCFSGYDDDGVEIGTELYQELKVGDFNTMKTLQKFAAQVSMSPTAVLTFSFDFQSRTGSIETFGTSYCMGSENVSSDRLGYGKASYGDSYGSAGDGSEGELPQYDSYKPFIRNFQRIFLRVTSSDFGSHTINMFFADIKEKALNRRRQITPC